MVGTSGIFRTSESILRLCLLSLTLLSLNGILRVNAVEEDEFEEVFHKCSQENPVTEEDFKDFSPGPDTKSELLAFFKCVLEDAGYIDGEGKLDVEKMKADDAAYESEPGADYDCMAKIERVKENSDMVDVLMCINPKVFYESR